MKVKGNKFCVLVPNSHVILTNYISFRYTSFTTVFGDVIKKAIIDSAGVPFYEQTLVAFIQKVTYVQQSVLVDPAVVEHVIGIQRSGRGQIYYTFYLDRSLHCSIASRDFSSLVQMPLSKEKNIPYVHISNDTNYHSNEYGVSVINVDQESNGHVLQFCNSRLSQMFCEGLHSCFSHNEKKRGLSTGVDVDSGSNSSVDSNCNTPNKTFIPSITLGFTNQCTQVYRKSRSSLFGHIRPYLRDGHLSNGCRRPLYELIQKVLLNSPFPDRFTMSSFVDNHEYTKVRKLLLNELKSMLVGDEDNVGDDLLLCEGIAILIPFGIGDHRDVLNDSSEGMNGVVAVHGTVPINDDTLAQGTESGLEFRSFLEANGYTDCFPCSVIIYTRRICHFYSERMGRLMRLRSKDALSDVVLWALTERVGDVVDYNATVFENENFMELFETKGYVREESRFQHRSMRTTAMYDKMVSEFALVIQSKRTDIEIYTHLVLFHQGSLLLHIGFIH